MIQLHICPPDHLAFLACELSVDASSGGLALIKLFLCILVNGGRINIASCSVGGAAFCVDRALNYSSERCQFGQPIGNFQAVQFKLAEMATAVHASRLLVRYMVSHDAAVNAIRKYMGV